MPVDTRAAVAPLAPSMHGPDLDYEPSILSATPALTASAPGIVTTGRNLQNVAHGADGMLPSVLLDERVSQRGRLLKIPTAFLRNCRFEG